MTDDSLVLRIWGARGSLPIASSRCSQFGGSTICLELRCGQNVLLFDAGSGLPVAGQTLWSEGQSEFHLFFSHCHYDHIMGLPFFLPLYKRAASVTLWSGHLGAGHTTESMIADFMRQPFFPVGPEVFAARIAMRTFSPGDILQPYDGVRMRTAMLNHPGGAVGYRVDWGGKSVAMIFDTDHVPGELDPAVMGLIEGADLFLYDANFTDEEFESHRSFGHSTWQQGVRLAVAAQVPRVAFLHHATFRSDAELVEIETAAQKLYPGAFCARDLQVIAI